MNNAQLAAAIAIFATNLDNSIDMGDRKNSVMWLAKKIGVEKANQVAKVFGLVDSYYEAK